MRYFWGFEPKSNREYKKKIIVNGTKPATGTKPVFYKGMKIGIEYKLFV